jgi:thioredoxin 1
MKKLYYITLISCAGLLLYGSYHHIHTKSHTSPQTCSSKNTQSSVIEVKDINHLKTYTEDKRKTVVIDFYASWCGPCKNMKPIFKELSQDMPSYTFIQVDIDEHKNIARAYDIKQLPTFVVIDKGVKKGNFSGSSDKKILKENIVKLTQENVKNLNNQELKNRFFKALEQCSIDDIAKYIKAGVDVNEPLTSDKSSTPLMFASSYCALLDPKQGLKIIDMLIEAGADVHHTVKAPGSDENISVIDLVDAAVTRLEKTLLSYRNVAQHLQTHVQRTKKTSSPQA